MTLEGAPILKPEHLAVFDCAIRVRPLPAPAICRWKATSG